MRLTLDVIAQALQGDAPQGTVALMHGRAAPTRLRGVRVLYETNAPNGELADDLLYVTTPELAQGLPHSAPVRSLAIAAGRTPDPARAAGHDVTGLEGDFEALVVTTTGTAELANRISDVFERYEAWDERLLTAIAEHRGLQDVLDIAAEELANPFAVFDSSSVLMAWAGTLPEGYEGSIWGDVLEKGYAPVSHYTQGERTYVGHGLSRSDEPIVIRPADAAGHEHLSIRLAVDDELYGMVSLVDLVAPFSPAERFLVGHVRDRLQQLFAGTIGMRHHRSPLRHCLRLLVSGDQVDERTADYHLRRRGWSVSDAYQLALLPLSAEADVDLPQGPQLMEAEAVLPGCLVIAHEGAIVAVRHVEGREDQRDERFREAVAAFRGGTPPYGLSDVFHGFMNVRRSWLQAKAALVEARQSPADAGAPDVVAFSEVFSRRLLGIVREADPQGTLLHPVALALGTGGPQDHELLACLASYLANGRSVSQAARALYMHRNTLGYRIEKLERDLGIDFDALSNDELFRLQVSCGLMLLEVGGVDGASA